MKIRDEGGAIAVRFIEGWGLLTVSGLVKVRSAFGLRVGEIHTTPEKRL